MAAAFVAVAQTETGQITGTVTDPAGAVVANAMVKAVGASTGTVRSGTTSSSGTFTLASLNPEDYDVTVEAAGFSTFKQRVTLTVGGKLGIEARLQIGQTGTTIEVAESAAQVNTETQTLSTTVSTTQILELPSLTRNPYDFVAISGNISSGDPGAHNLGFAVNGQRSSGNNILLNGVANNDEFSAGIGQQIPLDSVSEYSIITSDYTAEYGRASGGIVNVIGKSGTNDYHGSAYEFNRVSALAANSVNNDANGITKPVYVRNAFGFSIGGPVLPKLKNKLFFFENVEWTRIRSGSAQLAYIPTQQLISAANANTQSYFSALGKLRPGLSVLSTSTVASLGLCNGSATGGPCKSLSASTPAMQLVEWNVPADAGGGIPQNTWSEYGRVDYNLSDKTQVFANYNISHQLNFAGTNATSPYAGFDTGSTQANMSAILSVTHSFSPNLVNVFKADFNRFLNSQPLGTNPAGPTLYWGAQQIGNYEIQLPGYLPTAPGSAIPFGGPQNFVQAYEDLTVVHGKHDFRFGGSYTNLRDNRTFGAYENSVATLGLKLGDSTDNFLKGNLYSFQGAINPQGQYPGGTVTLPVSSPSFARSLRFNEFSVYGQDSWRVSPRLTLNLGLRWEYFGPPTNENSNLTSNFYLGGGSTYVQQVANGFVATVPNSPIKGVYSKDYGDVGPRVGFAYDLFGDGKTSFRGGYGISYERDFGNVTFNIIQNPPNYSVISLVAGADVPVIPISTSNAGPLAGSTGTKVIPKVSLRAIDQNLKTQYAQVYSAALEHQLSSSFIVSAEFTGSKGSRMYSITNPNRVGSGDVYLPSLYTCKPGSCSDRIKNTQYSNINLRGDAGASIYNALNLSFKALNWKKEGLTLIANYTWSHAIDDLSDTFSSSGNQSAEGILGFTDPFNPSFDRGNALFDQRHRFVVTAVWQIPYARGAKGVWKYIADGWSLSPIFDIHSGFPYTIYDSTNNQYYVTMRAALNGPLNQMSNVSGRPSVGANQDVVYNVPTSLINESYVNPITGNADFGPYPSNETGRNTFRNFGSINMNLSVAKSFKFTETKYLQLRFETYDTLNHSNFSVNTGSTDLANSTKITGNYVGSGPGGSNRNVQLGAKFIF